MSRREEGLMLPGPNSECLEPPGHSWTLEPPLSQLYFFGLGVARSQEQTFPTLPSSQVWPRCVY